MRAFRSLIIELDPTNVEVLDVVILQIYTEQIVEEKFLSLDPISSATVRKAVNNLTTGKMKGRRKCWKIKMKKRRKVKLMKRSRKSERTLNSCMRHGDDHGLGSDANTNILGMSVTTAETETDFEDCNNYAHAHVFSKCFKSLHTLLGFVLCFVLILCFVIVHSICIPNSCIFHVAKTGLLRCCLYTPRRLQ